MRYGVCWRINLLTYCFIEFYFVRKHKAQVLLGSLGIAFGSARKLRGETNNGHAKQAG
jgi:hypothetical protein